MKRSLTTVVLIIGLNFINFSYAQTENVVRLNDHWKFLRSDLGGIWEAVRPVKAGNPESVPLWEEVTLPHCFNATDAVDPDVNYYQGPGWYTNQIDIKNPYRNGRTLLHILGDLYYSTGLLTKAESYYKQVQQVKGNARSEERRVGKEC